MRHVCNRCATEKSEADFPYRKRNERGGRIYRYGWCKECVRAKDRERSKTAAHKAVRNARYHRDPRKAMIHNCRQTAESKGVPFALVESDIHIPALCPVLGIVLVVGSGVRDDASPSIDRLIPREGYVPHNIRVISWRANRIKSDATAEELEAIADYMRREAR